MRRIALFAVLAGALLGWMAIHVAEWLVVEDPLQPAVAIAVLGGKMPFRAMEAAELYRAGYAPEIWLPAMEGPAEHEPIKRMGFSPFEPDLYYKVLERLGVPRRAVRVLNPSAKNTRQEMIIISQALRSAGGGRVIVVTSPTHTRRALVVWTRIAWPFDELVIRYTRHEPVAVNLGKWWEKQGERDIVYREVGGIVDAGLGFPMVLAGR